MRVSVCIATYNGAQFIKQQLDSILTQLSRDDEVIISDDSSDDNTIDIIKSFNDNRIKLFENQKFRNHVRNFEFALKQASNPIIFLSDQDDVWVLGKVDIMKKELENYDIVVCDHSVIDEKGTILLKSYFNHFTFRSKPGFFRNLFRHSFSGCCMAFKKTVLLKCLPFPKDIDYHDLWIGMVGNIFFKVRFINQPLTLYRKHSDNVSFGTELKSKNSLSIKIKMRWNVIKYLPFLIRRHYSYV